MSFDNLRTVDGYPFRVLATGLPGDYPTAIFVEGHGLFSLDANNHCRENPGMSLVEQPRHVVRFFNIYRAADGGITAGSKAFRTDSDRRATQDSQRALFGLRVEYDDTTGRVVAEKAY